MRTAKGIAQPGLADRLGQVVDGVQLEGLDRILVVRGDENDQRQVPALEQPHDRQAVHFGHLQVQEGDIGSMLLDQPDRFGAVAGLPDDDDFGKRPQQRRQKRPGRTFVVGQYDPHR